MIYLFYSRLRHFFVAKHYRGHGVHSPFMYDFIRTVVMGDEAENFILRVENRYWPNKTKFVSSVDQLDSFYYVSVLGEPFRSRLQYKKWLQWRSDHKCMSIYLKGYLVVFFDRRLPNQHFVVRS